MKKPKRVVLGVGWAMWAWPTLNHIGVTTSPGPARAYWALNVKGLTGKRIRLVAEILETPKGRKAVAH